jgi:phage antirepressor YoqD-like protein
LHKLGIQYRKCGTWLLYQRLADRGYTQTRTYRTGENTCAVYTCWTQAGRLFLYETLKSRGMLPRIESGVA